MDLVFWILVQWLFLVWYQMIESWIDIPNLQTVKLFSSFEYVQFKSITSICINMNKWIDVSSILAYLFPTTYSYDFIESIQSNVTSIHLPDWTCNDLNYTIFDFSRFTSLEELEIGSDSFMNVNTFMIDGLNELKSLKIGKNSFTKKKNWYGNDISRSFHLLNCVELESIEIGRNSFSDYAGGFKLNNLPKLESITIGEIGSNSDNFYYCSFVIKGNIDDDIANE